MLNELYTGPARKKGSLEDSYILYKYQLQASGPQASRAEKSMYKEKKYLQEGLRKKKGGKSTKTGREGGVLEGLEMTTKIILKAIRDSWARSRAIIVHSRTVS